MFINKTTFNDIISRIRDLELKTIDYEDIVTCDTCGCLLYKNDAHTGESIIKRTEELYFGYDFHHYPVNIPAKEEIVTPYFCKVHVPKKSKKK